MRTCLLLLVLLPALSFSQARLQLAHSEYPPYDSNQLPWKGLNSGLVTTILTRSGYKVELINTPNNRAIEGSRRGIYDGSYGWARTPERERDLWYSDSFLSLRMVFCHRKGEDYPWQKLEDLGRWRIGVTQGNFYSDTFDRLVRSGKLKTEAALSDEQNLRKLLSKRIDLLPIDAEVGPYLMQQLLSPTERARLTCQTRSYWEAPVHLVISRKRADGAEIVRRFNQTLKQMQKSGEFVRLLTRIRQDISFHLSRNPSTVSSRR